MTTEPKWGPFGAMGTRAIVTGSARGIGLGIASRLTEAGARVLLVDIDGDAVATAAAELGAVALVADVSRDGQDIIAAAVRHFGGLDLLVNNAAVFPNHPALDLTPEMWIEAFGVNALGPAMTSIAAARQLIRQGSGGAIVNIASGAVLTTAAGLLTYAASKAALVSVTQALAKDLAPHRIRVNCVHPGVIATEASHAEPAAAALFDEFAAAVPLGRAGTPDDIATAVVFLASSAASYVTGAALIVDGGSLL